MTKTNRSSLSTRGFTLLEVLIAVLIVGIIATAAIPLVSDYAERARDAQIEANTMAVEMASQRYELAHKVPLGYSVDTSTDTLYDIFGDDGSGFWMQLVNPTDVNGNILGASLDPTANAFAYGPYLAPGSAKPASLLLGAAGAAAGKAVKDANSIDLWGTNKMYSVRLKIHLSTAPDKPEEFTAAGSFLDNHGNPVAIDITRFLAANLHWPETLVDFLTSQLSWAREQGHRLILFGQPELFTVQRGDGVTYHVGGRTPRHVVRDVGTIARYLDYLEHANSKQSEKAKWRKLDEAFETQMIRYGDFAQRIQEGEKPPLSLLQSIALL